MVRLSQALKSWLLPYSVSVEKADVSLLKVLQQLVHTLLVVFLDVLQLVWVEVLIVDLWLSCQHNIFPIPQKVGQRNKCSRPDELDEVIESPVSILYVLAKPKVFDLLPDVPVKMLVLQRVP